MSHVELLERVEIHPAGGASSADRAVIWLHGLGADGHDFEPVVPYLGLAEDLKQSTRFVFPHAPRRPVTINMGMVMPAWYDIQQTDLRRQYDEAGVRASAAQVRALIAHENGRGVPTERIVLAGFSQGGAIALFEGLRHPETLAGIMALSCYLVGEDSLDQQRHPANQATPIFQAHGDLDPMVPIARGQEARERLVASGYRVDWHTYPMGHQVHPDEITEIGAWLNRVLGNERG